MIESGPEPELESIYTECVECGKRTGVLIVDVDEKQGNMTNSSRLEKLINYLNYNQVVALCEDCATLCEDCRKLCEHCGHTIHDNDDREREE
jgi:hypothetical protein